MISTELIWFICGLVLILAEFAVPGVILVFFGIGAWIVALALFIGVIESTEAQLLLFAAASVALLLGLRKWIRQRFSGFVSDRQPPEENLDEFEGRPVVVIEDIAPGNALLLVQDPIDIVPDHGGQRLLRLLVVREGVGIEADASGAGVHTALGRAHDGGWEYRDIQLAILELLE